MGKTISELIEKTSANDSDVLFIEDSTSTNKITKANFLKELVNKTDNLSQRVEAVEKLKEGSELEVSTESGYVVCENTNNGQIEELKVEGKTLVNLIPKNKGNNVTLDISNNGTRFIEFEGDMIKLNTLYTFIINVKSNTASQKLRFPTGTHLFDTKNIVEAGQTGLFVFSVSSVSNTPSVNKISLICSQGTGSINFDIIVLEGDHTQNPPSYFDGLKSVGDGVDKIEVLSRKEDGNLFDGQLELGNRLGTTGELNESSTNVRSKGKYSIRVKPSVKYTVDMNITYVPIWVYEYAKDGSFIQRNYLISTNKSFTTTSRTAWLGFNDASSNTLTLDTRFMIYEAKNNPTYIFNQNKKQILYQNSSGVYEKPILRSTGSVSDSVEKHSNGKYYFHKRCNEIMLNGTENWGYDTPTKQFYIPKGNYTYTSESKCISDKFSYGATSGLLNNVLKVGTSNFISLRKDDLTGVGELKSWLTSNPVTVVYQLATEEVYECVNLDLNSYEGETSAIFDGGAISPKITFKIASHIANTIQVLKDRINYLEDKVIGMFKAVLAGDVQTLAYELYPEDFEKETTESIEGTELL